MNGCVELHQAQAFMAVARERSFTRGSVRLHRSQPAVSQAIAALELELRQILFERRPREAVLTAAGKALASQLEPLLGRWESIGARVNEALSSAPEGELAIGAGETALLHILPAAVRRFRDRYPSVRLLLRHQRREESAAALAAGELDLAVRSATELPAGVVAEPLIDLPRVVIAAAGHPLAGARLPSWRRLAREPWVLPPAGTDTRREIATRVAGAGSALRVMVETGGWQLITRYVALGLGVSAVPAPAITGAGGRGLAQLDVAPPLPAESFQVWLGPEARHRPAVRAFTEVLHATL